MMNSIRRRQFVAGSLSLGTALTGTQLLGQNSTEKALPNSTTGKNDKWFTRGMEKMTSREVEFYLKDGGGLVFIPFGPVSGHGAFIH